MTKEISMAHIEVLFDNLRLWFKFPRMNQNSLETGDMIAVTRLGFKHVGIYVGPRGFDGSCVVHNRKQEGVILSTLADFSGNSKVFILQKASGNFYEREMIAQRALSLLGSKYDLFKFNCEHAANYAQRGVSQSPQIAAAVIVAMFACGIAIFAGQKA
jgi:hypothetical protein